MIIVLHGPPASEPPAKTYQYQETMSPDKQVRVLALCYVILQEICHCRKAQNRSAETLPST